MELLIIGGLFLGVLLLFYVGGVPVGIAMGATSVIIMYSPYGPTFSYSILGGSLLFGLNSFAFLAIPFYLLLGRLMNRIGVTERIFRFARSIVGQFRGGIAYVNIIASMIFSGISGMAVADATGLGRVEYAAMRNEGYEKPISLGITGSSAVIGPIIPPSVSMIIYAVLAEQSIGALFLAGIIPGILLGTVLMITAYILLRYRDQKQRQAFSIKEVWHSFLSASGALIVPLIIIGGILLGIFTATEAGAIALLYTILLGFLYGELTIGTLLKEFKEATVETCSLTFIIAIAAVYGIVALELGLPLLMADSVVAFSENTTVILFLLVALLLVIGTFMEATAALTILVPILAPVMTQVGIDPIHFGVIMVLTLTIGLLTPPLGVILFILEKVTDATIEEVIRGVIPFYIPLIVVLIILILVPDLVTYIPYEYMG